MSDKAFVEWVNTHNVLSHQIDWSTKYLVDQYYETVIIPARLKAERERVIEKIITWINNVLPEMKRGNRLATITCDGVTEVIVIADKYGDENDIESLQLKQQEGI